MAWKFPILALLSVCSRTYQDTRRCGWTSCAIINPLRSPMKYSNTTALQSPHGTTLRLRPCPAWRRYVRMSIHAGALLLWLGGGGLAQEPEGTADDGFRRNGKAAGLYVNNGAM